MTRKKIGIYCTAIWGNNNKNHHRCCCPLLPALDPTTCGSPLEDGWTGLSTGTNVLSQPTDAGSVQGNTATGTQSASRCPQRTSRAVFLVVQQPKSLCSAVSGGCPHHGLLLPTHHGLPVSPVSQHKHSFMEWDQSWILSKP